MAASTHVTRAFCAYLKQHGSFAVGPALRMTDWVESPLAEHVGPHEYISREVIPFFGHSSPFLLRIPDVRSLVQDDRIWLAIETEIVKAIADGVRAQAPVADEIIHSQNLGLVKGYTAFPTAIKYGQWPREGCSGGPQWDVGPKLTTGCDGRMVPRWRVEQGALGKVDFRLIMRSQGELDPEQDPSTVPLSFTFGPVRVLLPEGVPRHKKGERSASLGGRVACRADAHVATALSSGTTSLSCLHDCGGCVRV